MRLDGYDVDLHNGALGAPADSAGWRYGSAGTVSDNLRVDCWLRLDGETVAEARFEVFGGPHALQAAAWLGGCLPGQTLRQAGGITGLAVADAAGLPVAARSEALCVEDALRAALAAPSGEGGA